MNWHNLFLVQFWFMDRPFMTTVIADSAEEATDFVKRQHPEFTSFDILDFCFVPEEINIGLGFKMRPLFNREKLSLREAHD